MTVINVASQFTRTPGGRYKTDGRFSGEEFREKILEPAYRSGAQEIVVNFDGVLGLSASFLEEAFGGLVRRHRPEKPLLLKKIKLTATRPYLLPYITLTQQYMRDA